MKHCHFYIYTLVIAIFIQKFLTQVVSYKIRYKFSLLFANHIHMYMYTPIYKCVSV